MALPLLPIAGAALGATVLGLLWMKSKKSSGSSSDPAKQKALTAAYAAGVVAGTSDGLADSGKMHNPRPLINFSNVADEQTQFENGYNDGYEKVWVAPSATVVTDSTPSAGGKSDKISAYDYGCSRGKSSGKGDYKAGYGSVWEANLATAGSKKRQAESGDAAQYRLGYKECYISAYTQAAVEDAAGDVWATSKGIVLSRDAGWGPRKVALASVRVGALSCKRCSNDAGDPGMAPTPAVQPPLYGAPDATRATPWNRGNRAA